MKIITGNDAIIIVGYIRDRVIRITRRENFNHDVEVNRILRSIDPRGERFADYQEVIDATRLDLDGLMIDWDTYSQNAFVLPEYKDLDPDKLSRDNYRYLRDSIAVLQNAGISHGDLPGNVMMYRGHPVIIDFTHSTTEPSDMDRVAFLTHYKRG